MAKSLAAVMDVSPSANAAGAQPIILTSFYKTALALTENPIGFSAFIPIDQQIKRAREFAPRKGVPLIPIHHGLPLPRAGSDALSLGAGLSLTPGETPFVNSTPAVSKARLSAVTVE